MTVRNMIEQLDNQLKQKLEDSPYFGPVKQFPDAIGAADRARLTQRVSRGDHRRDLSGADPAARLLQERISARGARRRRPDVHEGRRPAVPLPDRVDDDAAADPRGDPPDSASAKSRGSPPRWRRSRQEVGFKGTLQQFFDHLRTDPKFKEKSREALTQRYYDIGKVVDAKLPQYLLDHPQDQARDPAVRAVPREVRGRRQLRAGNARRLAAGHLLLQRLRPAVADDAGDHHPLPPRRRARAPFPDQPGAGE